MSDIYELTNKFSLSGSHLACMGVLLQLSMECVVELGNNYIVFEVLPP